MTRITRRAASSRRWILLVLAACSLGGCSFQVGGSATDGGGSAPRCGDCVGEDGGDGAPPVGDGTTVGFLETTAPDASIPEFILRGTLPIPARTYPRLDGRDPFVILDWNGNVLPTQTEIVTRYADESLGADVVEVLAKVHRDPAAPGGSQLRYEVVQAPSPALPGPGPLDLGDLLATSNVPVSIQDLLADPNGIEIDTYDCFGNRYACHPLDRTGVYKLMRRGKVTTEMRIYQTMKPEPFISGSGGTLPHFFGVHAYLATMTGQDILGLALRFNNGSSGRDGTTTADNPLDKVYFTKIEVRLPAGLSMMQDFDDPFLGGFTSLGDHWVWDLVKPLPAGKLHVMRWQGQFERRLWICTAALNGAARSYANGVGQGFCVRGTEAIFGHEYWSWWNKGTARYFPQKYQLPSMDHVGLAGLRGQLTGEQNHLAVHLRDGTSDGDYPVSAGVLGWGHPYGVSYGGMTSGSEIFCYDGVTTAASAATAGFHMYTALHRMQTDRMPTALYDVDGEPSSVERWLTENGSLDYVPFYCFLTPFLSSSYPDPFGFASAPRFQINYVTGNSLQAPYEGGHLSWDPYDLQHFIRYTRAAKVLAWLGNDTLAKDDLRMQAENFHLSYHAYCNDSSGGTIGSGLRASKIQAAAHPGKGIPFGRGESWGLDCAVASYALSSPAWRAAKRPWFRDIIEMLLEGQGTCTGFIQGFVSQKAVNGKYRARQQIEQSITENALQGLRETVFRDFDPGHADMTRDVLTNSLYAFIGDMAWAPGFGPYRYTGIGPLDISQPIWCSRSQMPGDAVTTGDIEAYQDWSSFAYGYELTGDPIFLERALLQFPGATDLYGRLKSVGTDNIENRSALLALLEHKNGEL